MSDSLQLPECGASGAHCPPPRAFWWRYLQHNAALDEVVEGYLPPALSVKLPNEDVVKLVREPVPCRGEGRVNPMPALEPSLPPPPRTQRGPPSEAWRQTHGKAPRAPQSLCTVPSAPWRRPPGGTTESLVHTNSSATVALQGLLEYQPS